MTLTQEHLDFENLCRQIIGLTIIKVEYVEVAYEPTNPKPFYSTPFKNLDSVDFSIFFHTDAGKLVEIYWDGKFFQYGIGVKINQPSILLGSVKWDVSDSELWKKFIGKTIVDTLISWETVTTTTATWRKDKFTYPQDLKIAFSNGKHIFISAAGFLNQGDDVVYGMHDNLMVTDDEELARQVKMIK